jgi:hypothetical protein
MPVRRERSLIAFANVENPPMSSAPCLTRRLTRCLMLCTLLPCCAALAAPEALDPEVEWSLEYVMPESTCVKPPMRQSNEVAGYLDRYKRKLDRYVGCVKDYQSSLIEDHQRIVAAAERGLTGDQAREFVAILKSFEATIEGLGEDVVIERDTAELERILSVGNRPSI